MIWLPTSSPISRNKNDTLLFKKITHKITDTKQFLFPFRPFFHPFTQDIQHERFRKYGSQYRLLKSGFPHVKIVTFDIKLFLFRPTFSVKGKLHLLSVLCALNSTLVAFYRTVYSKATQQTIQALPKRWNDREEQAEKGHPRRQHGGCSHIRIKCYQKEERILEPAQAILSHRRRSKPCPNCHHNEKGTLYMLYDVMCVFVCTC